MLTVEKTKRQVDLRFITCLSVVNHRDRERALLLAVEQCIDACLSQSTLFMQGMSGKMNTSCQDFL